MNKQFHCIPDCCFIKYDESEGGVCWASNPSVPPFTCKIENPSKESKFSGLKTFVEYKIHPQVNIFNSE
jgi:hypothetical protein